MSKIIKLTAEMLEQAKQEFAERCAKARSTNGSISFTKVFQPTQEKATLRFTELAWLKMKALVAENSKEVAWHGCVERLDGDVYLVSDILVYPQEVTGVTVDMDADAYAKWIQAGIVSGDDRFNHFYMQGHSHVDFAVSPSPTDLDHQKEILDMVRDNGFYVFVIWNKKNEHNIWIYDLQKNTLFENADVTVEVLRTQNGVVQFLADAAENVRTHTPVYTPVKYPSVSESYAGSHTSCGKTAASGGSDVQGTGVKANTFDQKKKITAHVDRGQSYTVYDDDDPYGPFGVRDYWSGINNYYGMED